MQTSMPEQEAELLLHEVSEAPRPWANRKVLGVVAAVGAGLALCGVVGHARQTQLTPQSSNAFMQAQQLPGPYGAQQGYAAGVGVGPAGVPIAAHPTDFIPFAQAQAMAGAAAPAAAAPAAAAPAAPAAAGLPGPYGAQQGYGAGVGHGPIGAPIAQHPEDFIAHGDAPAQQGNKAATLDLYYETKCPFSQQFITGEVKPALSDPMCVFKDVHINWEPYGNAQDTGGALMCQHGGDECFGNKLHICAKEEFGSNEEGLNNWVTCHFDFLSSSPANTARDMAGYQNCPGADAAKLTACANSPDIFRHFRRVGRHTIDVHPEHMPWAILGNGQPNLQGRLVQGLCEMYGTPGTSLADKPKPACCAV